MRELCAAGVTITTDHFVQRIDGERVTLFDVYHPGRTTDVRADLIVMATAPQSEAVSTTNCATGG
jgi:phytoene dehydrogenase-like protein